MNSSIHSSAVASILITTALVVGGIYLVVLHNHFSGMLQRILAGKSSLKTTNWRVSQIGRLARWNIGKATNHDYRCTAAQSRKIGGHLRGGYRENPKATQGISLIEKCVDMGRAQIEAQSHTRGELTETIARFNTELRTFPNGWVARTFLRFRPFGYGRSGQHGANGNSPQRYRRSSRRYRR